MLSVDSDVRERLTRYLDGVLSLDDFQSWFAPRVWDSTDELDRDSADLAAEIELRLAEMAHGDWTEREFRDKIVAYLRRPRPELHDGRIVFDSRTLPIAQAS